MKNMAMIFTMATIEKYWNKFKRGFLRNPVQLYDSTGCILL